jgi:hypothetical protein
VSVFFHKPVLTRVLLKRRKLHDTTKKSSRETTTPVLNDSKETKAAKQEIKEQRQRDHHP